MNDPLVLLDVRRLMVSTQGGHLLAATWGEYRPAVSYIGYVAYLTDYQDDDGTRTRPLYHGHLTCVLICRLTHL